MERVNVLVSLIHSNGVEYTNLRAEIWTESSNLGKWGGTIHDGLALTAFNSGRYRIRFPNGTTSEVHIANRPIWMDGSYVLDFASWDSLTCRLAA